MYHLNDWYFPRVGLTATAFNYGYLGVQLFFVISGFCIHLPFAQGRAFVVSDYCKRRFFRIYPPYIVTVILLFIAALWKAGWQTAGKADIINFLGHLIGWHYWSQTNDGMGVTPVLWTITIEMHFYLIYLFWRTCALGVSTFLLLVIFAFLAIVYRFAYYGLLESFDNLHPFFRPNRFSITRFDEWLAGAWIAELFVSGRLPTGPRRYILLGLGAMFVALGVLLSDELGLGKYALNDMSASAGFACILAGLLPMKPFPARLMDPLTYLGKISYSLYLVHPAVISFLVYGTSRSTITSGLFVLPLTVIAIWGSAHLFWKVVENPTHRFAQQR
jgi:peptidoglycan/LPS O-acetylase OafA/YrhL